MLVRKATDSDIKEIVEIHCKALPNDLLPRLGKGLLRNVFYKVALQSNQSKLLVASDITKVYGFGLVVKSSKTFSDELLGIKLVWNLGLALLKNPLLLIDLLPHFKRTSVDLDISIDILHKPELYLIAVDPDIQKSGGGTLLINEMINYLKDNNYSQFIVKTSSVGAVKFYKKNLFREIGVETRNKIQYLILIRDF